MKISRHLFLIALFFLSTSTKCQLVRGPSGSEFFLLNDWYFDDQYTHMGLFYSNDNGQTIEVNYEYGFPGSPQSLGQVLDDAEPGVLYNKPFYFSDFLISHDYGHSWESVEVQPQTGDFFSGKVPGEIFHYGFSNEGYLLKSNDYAQSFDTINTNVKFGFSVGVDSNIIYGWTRSSIKYNQYFINISHDNGYSFDECVMIDTSITGVYLEDIYRGANSGEVYLVSRCIPDHYKIFFSADNGHTWQYRSNTVYINLWSFSFTPGRASGTFYIARRNFDPTFTHTWLYIDYSSDTAKTFTTYFHDLTPEVGISQKGEQSDNVDLPCYPNPTDDLLYIKNIDAWMTNKSNSVLEIYDVFGNKMEEFTIKPNTNEFKINTSSYPSGLYFIRLMSEKGQNIINKFIISR